MGGRPYPQSSFHGVQSALPRASVQQVACPRCLAVAGSNCIGARQKIRVSNHAERVRAAISAGIR